MDAMRVGLSMEWHSYGRDGGFGKLHMDNMDHVDSVKWIIQDMSCTLVGGGRSTAFGPPRRHADNVRHDCERGPDNLDC